MEMLAANSGIILFLVLGFGIFMAWGIGANDVANAMGTSVGSGALTLKQAIIIAAVFEFLGAFLAGGEVTSTIRKGIIDPALFEAIPDKFVLGMLSALLAAATWLLVASNRGWPVSTTHSIVGAIVGFSAVVVSVDAVNWGKVGEISASWVVSPLLAGSIAWCLYKSVEALVLNTSDARASAARWVPVYMWMVGFMISMVTMLKGLKHVGIDIDLGTGSAFIDSALLSGLIGLLVAAARWHLRPSTAGEQREFRHRGHLRHFDDLHCLWDGLCTRIKRRSQRNWSCRCCCANCARRVGYCSEIWYALVGLTDWRRRYCSWPCHLWLACHRNNWLKNYRTHTKPWLCRRTGRSRHSCHRLWNRATYFNNAYPSWCGARRRSRARNRGSRL